MPALRRYAIPGITFLIGLSVRLLGVTNQPLGIGLMAVAVLWALVVLPPVSTRLPSLKLETNDGVAVRIRRPEQNGKKRIRQETLDLVKEIHEYVRNQPDSTVESMREFQATRGEDEAARKAAWDGYVLRRIGRSQQEQQQLAERFGGRARHLLGEYLRRGMVTEQEVSHVEWEMGSFHWSMDAAKTLEALALRL